MSLAIKWHYDQGNKGRQTERRAVLRAAGTATAIFVLAVLALLGVTFVVGTKLGLDLTFP